MYVIYILILIIFIAIFHGNKAPYLKIVSGSVFGILFFSVWKFFDYYTLLSSWSEPYIQITFLIMGIASSMAVLLIIKIRYEFITAYAMLALFVTSSIISLTYEVQIKNAIAFQTEYFKTPNLKVSTDKHNSATVVFRQPEAGYLVDIPERWVLRTDKGPYFNYYQLMNNNTILAEFRPRCFGKDNIAMTDIILNIQKSTNEIKYTQDTRCHHVDNSLYACKITKYRSENNIKRIRWLGMRDDIKKGVSMDFVLYQSNPVILQNITDIIESLRPATTTLSDLNCLGLAEWN